ncbi:arylsulfotransferase family protein [Pendulispora brunnea]|uniref:Arylsulfotransferase family protein n=1 Tax=Pendulispora brunnea TaxID=2905690 RepID=A0ABZ2JUS0_9BACT
MALSRSLRRSRSSRFVLFRPLSVLGLVLVGTSAHADSENTASSDAPELRPPEVTVLTHDPRAARGLIFIAPKARGLAQPGGGVRDHGPEIVDDEGHVVWFNPLPDDEYATDFRVQRYRGEPVLTWSQGKGFGGLQHGETTNYILDRSYHVIAKVRAGHGLNADSHEFFITPRGTALITIYNAVARDLSSVGGSTAGKVIDGVVQEIDIESGNVLFEWHSLDHVPLDETNQPAPASADKPYDYFHLNAVSPDEDGNLLISARHTSTVYKLDRHSGKVLLRLGGKRSDVSLDEDTVFAYQHNPIAAGFRTIRIFDNESNGTPVLPASRILWIRHDRAAHTATLLRALEHPEKLSAASQGNAQGLVGDHTFVGWGQLGRVSEFDERGRLTFDAKLPTGYDTYRAYRFEWNGEPDTAPIAKVQSDADGTTRVHAIWNGATRVARWVVRGGDSTDDLRPIASGRWAGLDTALTLPRAVKVVQVVAENRGGGVIGRSAPVPVTP